MVDVAGERTMWSSVPAVTDNDAVPDLPASLAVIVWAPAVVAVHEAPAQEPFGAIERLDAAVTSPRELSYWSRPSTVYVWDAPAAIVALAGVRTRWSSVAATIVSDAVPVFAVFVAVTVCAPAVVAVHVAPVQEPFGAIESAEVEVTSPSELLY